MEVGLLLLVGILAGVLCVGCASGTVIGMIAAVSGGYVERCPRCHHYGLNVHGQVHGQGCPEHRHAVVHLPAQGDRAHRHSARS